jgi:hypothetical protein
MIVDQRADFVIAKRDCDWSHLLFGHVIFRWQLRTAASRNGSRNTCSAVFEF